MTDWQKAYAALYGAGYTDDQIAESARCSRVVINQVLTIAAELGNIGTESTHVVLLLKMDEPGKNGGRRLSSYAIWRGELAPGEARVVSKKIHFVHRNSVPKEPGTYYLTLSVNGRSSERGAFEFSI